MASGSEPHFSQANGETQGTGTEPGPSTMQSGSGTQGTGTEPGPSTMQSGSGTQGTGTEPSPSTMQSDSGTQGTGTEPDPSMTQSGSVTYGTGTEPGPSITESGSVTHGTGTEPGPSMMQSGSRTQGTGTDRGSSMIQSGSGTQGTGTEPGPSTTQMNLQVSNEIPANEERLTNKCKYECKMCQGEFESYLELTVHGQSHQRVRNEKMMRRTRTTFLKCQLCQKLIYCDTQILHQHLLTEHSDMTLTEYCLAYKDFLAGEENETLEQRFESAGIYSALSVEEDDPLENSTNASPPAKRAKIIEPSMTSSDEVALKDNELTNKCVYECQICQEKFLDLLRLRVHGEVVHNRTPDQMTFKLTYTTFIRCRICMKILYCDSHVLERHLSAEHPHMTLIPYCNAHKKYIEGTENKTLALRFQHDQMHGGPTFRQGVKGSKKKKKKSQEEEAPTVKAYCMQGFERMYKTWSPIENTKDTKQQVQHERQMLQMCWYKCGLCNTPFQSLKSLEEHSLEHSNNSNGEIRVRKTIETFIQCQLCHKFLFCDMYILGNHLSKSHPGTSLAAYSARYKDALKGRVNPKLSEQFKKVNEFRAVDIRDPASKKSASAPPNPRYARVVAYTDSVMGRIPMLENRCTYQCSLCQHVLPGHTLTGRHAKKIHKMAPSKVPFTRVKLTFLRCQICRKFVFCDSSALSRHLTKQHKVKRISEYNKDYPGSLKGKESEALAKIMEHASIDTAVDMPMDGEESDAFETVDNPIVKEEKEELFAEDAFDPLLNVKAEMTDEEQVVDPPVNVFVKEEAFDQDDDTIELDGHAIFVEEMPFENTGDPVL